MTSQGGTVFLLKDLAELGFDHRWPLVHESTYQSLDQTHSSKRAKEY